MKRQPHSSLTLLLSLITFGGTSILGGSLAFAQANQPIVYTYNSSSPPHAPASDNFGHQFQYDANGNQMSIVHGSSAISMSYNHLNKLRSVQNGLAPTVEYRYDNSGTKTAKLIGGVISERYFGSIDIKNGVKTRYYFMGGRRIAERKMDGSGSIQFYQPDHLSSTSLVTNQNGAEVHRADYYEFGAIRKEQGSETKDYAYNDKRRERETDFYDYGARAYAAKFMKFTSPDSIIPSATESISLNRYAYVNNNPMKYVDPSGHRSEPFQNYLFASSVGPADFFPTANLQTNNYWGNVALGAINNTYNLVGSAVNMATNALALPDSAARAAGYDPTPLMMTPLILPMETALATKALSNMTATLPTLIRALTLESTGTKDLSAIAPATVHGNTHRTAALLRLGNDGAMPPTAVVGSKGETLEQLQEMYEAGKLSATNTFFNPAHAEEIMGSIVKNGFITSPDGALAKGLISTAEHTSLLNAKTVQGLQAFRPIDLQYSWIRGGQFQSISGVSKFIESSSITLQPSFSQPNLFMPYLLGGSGASFNSGSQSSGWDW